MLRTVKSLYGYSLHAMDGMIGKVHEIFFIDDSWDIAYIVVRIGGVLRGRRVLLRTSLCGKPEVSSRSLPVTLTRAQVARLPGVESDMPVSSYKLMLLREYYEVPGMVAGGGFSVLPVPPPSLTEEEEREIALMESHRNPHLRRSREVSRYHLQLKGGLRCPVDDIIMDDAAWCIMYFVVATGGWLNKRKVLIESANVTEIQWGEKEVVAETPQGLRGRK
jgi:hypothetical protein